MDLTRSGKREDVIEIYSPAFLTLACLAALLFCLQLRYCTKLRILPAALLPLCSFCICFKNAVLWRASDDVSSNADVAQAVYVFSALIEPLMIATSWEVAYRLHEARSAHFLFIPFDQEELGVNIPGILSLWFVRLVATGLFVMSIIVNFHYLKEDTAVGRGGYITLSQQPWSTFLWLSLIPTIVLSGVSLVASLAVYRYGINVSLGLLKTSYWKLPLITVLAYIVGKIFDTNVYMITSNSGELCLLIGLTLLIKLVQQDLAFAGNFADFLHRSNHAFSVQSATQYGVVRNNGERRSSGSGAGDLTIVSEVELNVNGMNDVDEDDV